MGYYVYIKEVCGFYLVLLTTPSGVVFQASYDDEPTKEQVIEDYKNPQTRSMFSVK